MLKEEFDDVVRDYIDFVNQQVGVYMDALAGFAGHRTRIGRQVHRVNRPTGSRVDDAGRPIVVWASYEDPTKPDIIHNRIIRAVDYIPSNSEGGSNEQQHARAVLVFLFAYWEDEIRPRLAAAKAVPLEQIRSDVMGDLRIVRNVILHAKGVMRPDKHKSLKRLGDLFVSDHPLFLSCEAMDSIFVRIKQDCAAMLLDWLKVKDAPIKPDEIRDIAIKKARRPQ